MGLRTIVACSLLCAFLAGCGPAEDPADATTAHRHDAPAHMPRSLEHLCRQIRSRLSALDKDVTDAEVKTELADLVSWAPEFAADTDIGERRWIPIYELSEQIRKSIETHADDWGIERRNQITRLCQVSEDAWWSLSETQRVDRYQGHQHDDHDHGHDHGHGHGHHHSGDEGHDHDHLDGHGHDRPAEIRETRTAEPVIRSEGNSSTHRMEVPS